MLLVECVNLFELIFKNVYEINFTFLEILKMLNQNFEFVNILNISSTDDKETIKQKYYFKLREYYTELRALNNTETNKNIIENLENKISNVTKLYTNYFCNKLHVTNIEEDAYASINIYSKCVCRCGGEYSADMLGVEECDFCSCYIFVHEERKKLQ